MKEITFFGRGGQGAVVASEILAEAYFRQGYQVQCFPSFGVERRGAPVTAFLRVDDHFIYLRSMIYKADVCVVLSPEIINSPMFKSGAKAGAAVLINSKERLESLSDFKASYVDATGIALKHSLGSKTQPLINTAMLGAFASISDDIRLESLLEAIKAKVPYKPENNVSAASEAYQAVISDG